MAKKSKELEELKKLEKTIDPIEAALWHNPKLTFKDLADWIKKHHIPEDVQLFSDCRWECGPSDCGAVSYNPWFNALVFTTGTDGTEYEESYLEQDGWTTYAREDTLANINKQRKEWRKFKEKEAKEAAERTDNGRKPDTVYPSSCHSFDW